jgi:phenylacetate-CoA ligase
MTQTRRFRGAVSRKNAWAALPAFARRAIGSAIGVLPPERILGRRFREARAFLERAERWPAERAREYQLQRLRDLCRVARRTAYYRDAFDAIGFDPNDLRTPDDVRRLPLLDRDTIRQEGARMLADNARSLRLDAVSTGGTGGVPLHFYIGADRSPIEYAYLTHSWRRVGYSLGDALAVMKGDIVPPDRDGLRHEYDPLLRRHHYSTFHLSERNLERYLAHIGTIGDCYLLAYPSVIAMLARFLRRASRPAPANIRGIIGESEIVYPDQRALAEEVFGCRYFSAYGLTEKVVAAAECEYTHDYHVWPTYGIFELLDAQGQPVRTPGERGEIVGTSFINTAMPFIRYRTGDFATYVGDRCGACGRDHPIVTDVRGHRVQESLIAADGALVPWSALNMHDDTFLHVDRFQFRQHQPGRATLRVIPGAAFSENDRERILRKLAGKLGGVIELSLETVTTLPVTERGKAVYVDQRIADSGHAEAKRHPVLT